MKEQILAALKTKFEGVSDAILNRIADKMAKTAKTDDEVATAIEGVTLQSVLESYGDSRATEAQQTAVTNYERKHGLKEGQAAIEGEPITPSIEAHKGNDDTPAWAKTLMDSNKTLADKLATLEGDKIITTRKQKLTDIVAKAPNKFKQRIEKDFGRMSFQDEEEYNTWLDEVKSDADDMVNQESAKGAVFGRPIGGGGDLKSKPTLNSTLIMQKPVPNIVGVGFYVLGAGIEPARASLPTGF